jgi:hypothetical protein
MPTYPQLESFAIYNFEYKELSTLRCKCKSIFNWYEERDFKLPRRKPKMSRAENIKRVRKEIEDLNKIRVENLISGNGADIYKKKNGKWHIQKIADELNLNRKTVSKYIN